MSLLVSSFSSPLISPSSSGGGEERRGEERGRGGERRGEEGRGFNSHLWNRVSGCYIIMEDILCNLLMFQTSVLTQNTEFLWVLALLMVNATNYIRNVIG